MQRVLKPTKKAVQECFKGVPNYLWFVRKDSQTGELSVSVNRAANTNYAYALEKLCERFELVYNPAAESCHPDIYILKAMKP